MISFLLVFLLLISIAVGFLFFYGHSKKILLSISSSALLQMTEYMVLASLFAKVDYYSSVVFLLVSLGVNVLIALPFRKKIIQSIKGFQKPKMLPIPYIATFILCMCTLIFMNGFFGFGQDQGCYQVKALALSNGETRNTIHFEDENNLINEWALREGTNPSDYSIPFYREQEGFYQVEELKTTDETMSAIVHGTVGYPALLALDVELFGISGMLYINYLLMFMSFVFMLEMVNSLEINKFMGSMTILISLISPVVIWIAKTSLTESVQLPLVIAMALGFTYSVKNNRIGVLITTIAAIGFAAVHLSAFSVLPIIGVLLLINYLRTNDWFSISCIQIIAVFYLAIFKITSELYFTYVYGNLTVSLAGLLNKTIPHKTCIALVIYTTIGLSLASLLFLIPIVKKIARKLMDTILYPGIIILVGLFCARKIFIYIVSYSKQVDLRHALSSLTLFGLSVSTGIILMPLAIALGIWFSRKILKDRAVESLLIMFVYYNIFIYSTVHPVVPHYYYYSRYFATTVFLVPLVFAFIVTKYLSNKKIGRIFGYASMVVALVVILPYSIFMSSLSDDTRLTFKQYEALSSKFNENDAVVFYGQAQKVLMSPIKFTSGADVYSANAPIKDVLEKYDHVYAVTMYNDTPFYDGVEVESLGVHVSSDPQRPHKYFLPLFDYEGYDTNLSVFVFDKERIENAVTYTPEQISFEGMTWYQGDYIWSFLEESAMDFYVPDIADGAMLHIDFSLTKEYLPADVLDEDITVKVNENVVYEGKASQIPSDLVVDYEDLIENSQNRVEIYYTTWIPSQWNEGSTDDRTLGVCLKGLEIK